MADEKKVVSLSDAKKVADGEKDDAIPRLSVEQALELARAKGLEDVVIVGWAKGEEDYFFAASNTDMAEINYLLDRAKFDLLTGNY